MATRFRRNEVFALPELEKRQVEILAMWTAVDESGLHKLKGRQVLLRGLHCVV